MLSGKTLAVLKAVVELSGGTFKVLDADDIIEKVEGEKPQKLELSGIIKSLAEQGLVKVKTASTETYCIQSLTRATLALEGKDEAPLSTKEISAEQETVRPKTEETGRYRTATVVELEKVKGLIKRAAFFGAFFGALIGGAVVGGLLIVLFKLIVK